MFISGKHFYHDRVRKICYRKHNDCFFIPDFPCIKLNNFSPECDFTHFSRYFLQFNRLIIKISSINQIRIVISFQRRIISLKLFLEFIFSYLSYVVVSQSLPRLQTCSTYCSKEPSRTSAFPLAAAEAQHGRCSLAAHSSAAAGRLGSASCCSNSGIELASSLLASNDRALPPLRWHASGPSRLGRLVDRACCPSLALPSMVAGVARRLNGLQ